MRRLNEWQIVRVRRIADRRNRAMALPAFGLGMTLQQYKKLSEDQRHAAWAAYCRLTSPEAMLPERPNTGPRSKALPQRWERISDEEKRSIGRKLLAIKSELPRGHFGPWLRDESGLTFSQAQRYMRLAK